MAMAKSVKTARKKAGGRVKRIDVHSHVVPRDPERFKMRYVAEGQRRLVRKAGIQPE
jgi:hypothetical protein